MAIEPRLVIPGWEGLRPHTGLGRTQTQALIAGDEFPPGTKLSARRVIWWADEIALWQKWRLSRTANERWSDFIAAHERAEREAAIQRHRPESI